MSFLESVNNTSTLADSGAAFFEDRKFCLAVQNILGTAWGREVERVASLHALPISPQSLRASCTAAWVSAVSAASLETNGLEEQGGGSGVFPVAGPRRFSLFSHTTVDSLHLSADSTLSPLNESIETNSTVVDTPEPQQKPGITPRGQEGTGVGSSLTVRTPHSRTDNVTLEATSSRTGVASSSPCLPPVPGPRSELRLLDAVSEVEFRRAVLEECGGGDLEKKELDDVIVCFFYAAQLVARGIENPRSSSMSVFSPVTSLAKGVYCSVRWMLRSLLALFCCFLGACGSMQRTHMGVVRGTGREDEEFSEQLQGREDPEEEAERQQNREDGLCLFIQRLGFTSENRGLWNVTLDPPRGICLSEISGVSSEKVFLVLDLIPSTVEEMAIKKSIGTEEAKRVFPLLSPYLEFLCLKGCRLGMGGFEALAGLIAEGRIDGVKTLDLQKTGLNKHALKALHEAIKQRSLKVETLDLSGNKYLCRVEGDGSDESDDEEEEEEENEDEEKVFNISRMFRHTSLQCMREAGVGDLSVQRLALALQSGSLLNLEKLDLERHRARDVHGPLGPALDKKYVPCLKSLNLMSEMTGTSDGLDAFLHALSAPGCPPLENVEMCASTGSLAHLRSLGDGRYKCIRKLHVDIYVDELPFFLQGINGAAESPYIQALSLDLMVDSMIMMEPQESIDAMRGIGEAVRRGRFGCLQRVQLYRHEEDEGEAWGEGEVVSAFFEVLSQSTFPFFRGLCVRHMAVSDTQMMLLAQAVRAGHLSGLQDLELSEGGQRSVVEDDDDEEESLQGFGGDGMLALMEAVMERPEGLPCLESLNLSSTRAGEGGRAGGFLARTTLLYLKGNDEVLGGTWEEFMQVIAESQGCLRKLETLDLSWTRVEEAGGGVVLALGSGELASLQRLCCRLFFLDARGVRRLADAVRGEKFPPGLDKIDLKLDNHDAPVRFGCARSRLDPLFVAIAEGRRGLPQSVLGLDLRGGRIGEGALALLAESRSGGVNKLSGLNSLDLSDCSIDDGALRRLGEVFSAHTCPNLETLALRNNPVSLEAVSDFLTQVFNIESQVRLHSLDILDFSEAGSLGGFCMSGTLRRLSHIDFKWSCDFTDGSLEGLSEFVRRGALSNVVSLSLPQTPKVSGAAWRNWMTMIAESEEGLPKLRWLDLTGHAVRFEGGAVTKALGSGKLPVLESLFPFCPRPEEPPDIIHPREPVFFQLNSEGVGALSDAVRGGKFPPSCFSKETGGLRFQLCPKPQRISIDPLITAIAESEGGLPQCVRALHLRGGQVEENALTFLASSEVVQSAGRLSSLESLDLSDCSLDDTLLKRVAEVFSAHGCPNLKSLALQENRLSITGVCAFLETPQLLPESLPQLKNVKFEGQKSPTEEEGVEMLNTVVHNLGKRVPSLALSFW
uniref:Uncharacterized protein n=1 Tax=Chromera velia CCMP2878 TaxID=1169474 RepID=A0A0G4I8U5_9ALVE|eukprot:Cvel_11982.t1-p1 / transcript=Cvel_11982.t1 / gene=Cvel_11982 / organism=Chromera_velia_CCMP2878 / gene_product=hypothetical protein / transcript_product=hypothetical protein / location=Cvel_scaffold768:41230-48343(-) / protein_length=1403 / sequence_SO=supercontig / SO=protein_coding / is_pseudo=false